jgi:hypothetical protein
MRITPGGISLALGAHVSEVETMKFGLFVSSFGPLADVRRWPISPRRRD